MADLIAAEIARLKADVAKSVSAGSTTTESPIGSPLSIVVFGATGDLAREKLYPSFQQLMLKGLLPYGSTIMGFGRSAVAMEDFFAKQLVKVKFTSDEEEAKFKGSLDYFKGGYDSEEDFAALDKALAAKEAPGADRLYFLSVPPTVFGAVCTCINNQSRAASPGKTQVLVEKPFGRDSRTFAALNELTANAFDETELFRLDHYLAKHCIQNLVRQRIERQCFFDSIWNKDYIKSVHVSWKEDIDTEGRGGYFDEFGIVRDIMQNHLLQLFMFTVMELGDGSASQWAHRHSADPSPLLPCPTQSVPADSRHCNWLGSAEAVAANKVKLLESIKALAMDDAVLGQFEGYLADDTVPEGSVCPTYAAVSIAVDNERWAGVPMMITAGKGLSERTCTVEAAFKPGLPYKSLLLRVQPDPGLWLVGPKGSVELPFMEAMPGTGVFDYERILFDGARGSKLLMIGADELREAWRIFTPLLDQIDQDKPQPVVHTFQTVVPPGVTELAKKLGMEFNAVPNAMVAGAKM